jgi:hypothetical protein
MGPALRAVVRLAGPVRWIVEVEPSMVVAPYDFLVNGSEPPATTLPAIRGSRVFLRTGFAVE